MNYHRSLIRATDLVVSFLSIIALFPFFLLLAVVMLLFQGAPVLFWQKRGGRNGKLFLICKLRTMRNGTEDVLGLTKGLDDERITRMGAVLRKYKLDELPQIINVLKGEMSIVGSRPQVPYYIEQNQEVYAKVLAERPGLLSPAATLFRDEEEFLGTVADPRKFYEEKLLPLKSQMDIDLVTNLTYRRYLGVILLYLMALLFNKGRYSGKSLPL